MLQAGRSLRSRKPAKVFPCWIPASCRSYWRDHHAARAPYDVDGAILFSDIVVPLRAAGVGVEIVPGRGRCDEQGDYNAFRR